MTVLAHTSHWLTSAMYLVPVLAVILLLAVSSLRGRRGDRQSPTTCAIAHADASGSPLSADPGSPHSFVDAGTADEPPGSAPR